MFTAGRDGIFEDGRGNLWIGNNGFGVLLYDGQAVSSFTDQHGLSIREKGPSGVGSPNPRLHLTRWASVLLGCVLAAPWKSCMRRLD